MSQAGGSSRGGPTRRPVSVTLRDQAGQEPDVGQLMDPATKSLADALRITYRILQLGIVALAGLFLFSGFQSVREGERGIRLFLGRVDRDDLPPGFQFTAPEPMGELIRISTGAQTLRLENEFFPNLRDELKGKTVDQLRNAGSSKLDPAVDGQLITADFNVAHARANVTYRRERPLDNARTITPADEVKIVRAAVARGVLHATSGVSIDEFVKAQPDPGRERTYVPVATGARRVAQETLDQLGAGLQIDDLTITDRTPPLPMIADFERVQTNQANASKEIETAGQDRVRTLAAAAGDAHGPLLRLIDAYEAALAEGRREAGEKTLASIDGLFDGQAVDVSGTAVPPGTISGDAARLLASAREYRSSVVNRARADAALFAVKLEAYHQNPSVLLTGEWSEAFTAFMARDNVEAFILPSGTRMLELPLNRDQDLLRQREVATQRRTAEERLRREAEDAERSKFESKNPQRPVRGD